MYNPYYNNNFLNSGNKLYQPPELVLNPLAKNIPKREINLGLNLWGPNLPSVIKLYDPLTGKVKAVVDPTNPTSNMSLEEYENNPLPTTPQIPFQNYSNPLFSTNSVKTQPNPPFDILTKITTSKQPEIIKDEIVDIFGKPFNSPNKNPSDWKIINNNFSLNKSILINSAGEKFSGSGILLIENIDNKLYFTLVKSKRGLYEDPGGEISKNLEISENTLKNNAVKEALEESNGLLYITSDLNMKVDNIDRYVDIEDGNGLKYRCFIIAIEYSDNKKINLSELYLRNKYNIGMFNNLGADWNETYELTRFDVKNILIQISNLTDTDKITNDMYINNDKGQQTGYKLRCRTVKVLHKLLDKTNNYTIIKKLLGNKITISDVTCNPNNRICYITL